MAIRSDEIGEILKKRIASFEAPVVDANEGVITSVSDGIARIYGLERAMAGELLELPGPGGKGKVLALALDLREDGVGAVILGPYEHLQEGDTVVTTGRIAEVPVGDELVGRVVNALGEQLDDRGPIETAQSLPTERVAPGVIQRRERGHADADRSQVDRRDDPDRSWSARADHRRPPDRQDRDRHRRNHQPEGHRGHLHLRRDRSERAEGGPDQSDTRAVRRHGAHHHRGRHRIGPGATCSSSPPTLAARWASTSWRKAVTR